MKKKRRPAKNAPKRAPAPDRRAFWLANLLVLGVFFCGWLLEEHAKDLFLRLSQEDESLEWGTFWAFIAAAAVSVAVAARQRAATGKLPWFALGVGFFCFVVAMEEISWGQRLVGYRPPEYFLQHNFQQELNVHNVISSSTRKLALKAVILGYGVVLPLVALWRPVRRLFERFAVVAPPVQLIPAFFATYWLYEEYPWKFTGEWAELMLGLGFLFAGVLLAGIGRPLAGIGAAALVALALGALTATVVRGQFADRPELRQAAEDELEALRRDFLSGKVKSKPCKLHKRLFTFKEEREQDYLGEGEFARLAERGLPEARAEFLLDPWNSPYWLRDRCKDDRRILFVYSFGPDRRRDSTPWEIIEDDVGAVIYDGPK